VRVNTDPHSQQMNALKRQIAALKQQLEIDAPGGVGGVGGGMNGMGGMMMGGGGSADLMEMRQRADAADAEVRGERRCRRCVCVGRERNIGGDMATLCECPRTRK
jgi:hypothetical protein